MFVCYQLMDSDRVILVAGVTAVAAVVGTFILWGPSTAIRPKRKGSTTFVIAPRVPATTTASLLRVISHLRFLVE